LKKKQDRFFGLWGHHIRKKKSWIMLWWSSEDDSDKISKNKWTGKNRRQCQKSKKKNPSSKQGETLLFDGINQIDPLIEV
jgi:hypothetical protein